jgi:ABC-type sugar transport system ATPase subunit
MTRDNNVEMLKLVAVNKGFSGVKALDNVSFSVKRGTVHGLIGHNGAGKSTLVKVLCGAYHQDSGTIILENRICHFSTTGDAVRRGIGVLFQEPSLSPNMTIEETIWLEEFASASGYMFVSRKLMRNKARQALDRLGLALPVDSRISLLTTAERQLVALARIFLHDPKVLVLDEPTAPLGAREIGRVMDLIHRVRGEGVSVIYVSHRLSEVIELCDEITVLRDGKLVETIPQRNASVQTLVHLMVGEVITPSHITLPKPLANAEVALEVENWTRSGASAFPDIYLRKGEVLGLCGLPGSGREQIMHCVVGLSNWSEPTLRVNGTKVPRDPCSLHHSGIGMVTADRHGEGIFPLLSVQDNVAAGLSSISGVMRDFGRERNLAKGFATQLSIRMRSLKTPVGLLSGGNQQKVLFARMLAAKMRVMLIDEPTLGIDVSSREELYEAVRILAGNGNAFIVGSSDPEELANLSSQIWVVHNFRFVAKFDPPFDVSRLLAAATGGMKSN